MLIDETVLSTIVGEIWSSMLGLGAEVATSQGADRGRRQVCATVQITGAWDGAVVIRCDDAAAVLFAAAMLGEGEAPPSEADVQDVMGELANMAGGNLKASIRGVAHLSLPTVVAGNDLDLAVPGAVCVERETFVAARQRFDVSVLARGGRPDTN